MPEYYVYDLIDPRTGETFYVGKGRGDRKHQHARDARKGGQSERLNRIREIAESGHQVLAKTIKTFQSEAAAYSYEAERIKEFGRDVLTNIQVGGHGGRWASDAQIAAEKAAEVLAAYKVWENRGSVQEISLGKHGTLNLKAIADGWLQHLRGFAAKYGFDKMVELAAANGIQIVVPLP